MSAYHPYVNDMFLTPDSTALGQHLLFSYNPQHAAVSLPQRGSLSVALLIGGSPVAKLDQTMQQKAEVLQIQH